MPRTRTRTLTDMINESTGMERLLGLTTMTASGCLPCQERASGVTHPLGSAAVPTVVLAEGDEPVSEGPWNFSPADYTDEQWIAACVLDRGEDAGTPQQRYGLPIREPDGTLNRNGVHAAAQRFNQVQAPADAKAAAAAKLRGAYSTLGEDPPDVIANAATESVITLAAEVVSVPAATWSGVIGVEGELTGDGRMIEKNALRWEDLPLPLRYVSSDVGAHDGAQVVGRITSITRNADGQIIGEGDFDTSSAVGLEAMRQVEQGLTNGVSMDLDDVSFEVRIAADVLDGDDGFFPLFLAAEPTDEPDEPATDEDGRVTIMEINSDDEVRVTTEGRIRAATIVAIPAFASAKIHLTGEVADGGTNAAQGQGPAMALADALVAAAPLAPPASWFSDPKLTGATAITVTEDGRVYGHLGLWGTCHIGHSVCTPPPHSITGYSYFHTGAVMTAEGAEVSVGHITMDTRHAYRADGPAVSMAHYEHTGTVVADVTAGEDAHGIWVAGALRPSVTDQQIRAFRAAPLSGDWRRIAGNLELVAALAVNVPGYPVPRPSGLVAGGVVTSLVAAGMVAPRKVRPPGTNGALSVDDLRYLKRLIARERAEESIQAAAGTLPAATELARRVRASSLAMRVHRPTGR